MKNGMATKTPDKGPYTLFVSGFGGQGVLMIGNLLAYAAMIEGKHVSYLPFYGVEMRGGAAYCTLVVSSDTIGSPVITRTSSVIAMDAASFIKHESKVIDNGLMLVNSSLIDTSKSTRQDVEMLSVPVNDIARDYGNAKLANMVALGAFVERTKLVEMDALEESLKKTMGDRYASLIQANLDVIQKGVGFVRSLS
jgi:2-oxoglutarate ferredoxin oxidoreductase subunit gamma